MSTTMINMPVLLAQLPHLAKLTSAEQSGPAAQARFSEELAKQQHERSKEQVEKTQKQDKSTVVGDDEAREEKREAAERERKKPPPEEPREEEETSAPKSPWAGNILNLKI